MTFFPKESFVSERQQKASNTESVPTCRRGVTNIRMFLGETCLYVGAVYHYIGRLLWVHGLKLIAVSFFQNIATPLTFHFIAERKST